MPVLSWDKPKKVMSTEAWKSISADDAPPGVYTPNMSAEDMQKWKAKLVGKNTPHPRVEIRKSTGHSGRGPNDRWPVTFSAQMLIIVSLGEGYPYKGYSPEALEGINVQISMNGQTALTFEEAEQMHQAIQEARSALESLSKPSN